MEANKILIFKVCVAALWANEKMVREERDYINNLVERLAETEEDRDFLRKIETLDVSLKILEPEVKSLPLEAREHIFEESFGIITSDKILDALDLRFLKYLKNICGIKNSYYRNKIKEARIYKGVKIKRKIKKLVFAVMGFWLFLVIIARFSGNRNLERFLKEDAGKEIIKVQMLSESDLAKRKKNSAQEIYKNVCNSVVTAYLKEDGKKIAQGTGSIISKDEQGYYYILTNKHVVSHRKLKFNRVFTYEIELYNDAKFDASLDFYSRNFDLAILKAKIPQEPVKVIKISPKKFQNIGDRVYSLGTPIGMSNTFTEGIISGLRDEYIQTDATVFFGNSGGPLLSEYGELIGVVTLTYIFKDYSFAIYADKINDLLEERANLKKVENK